MKCRSCGGNLEEVFCIDSVPLSGYFPSKEKEEILSGNLTLVKCNSCGLVQLKESYPLDEMYGENYGYRSGLNPSMVTHLNENIIKAQSKVNLESNDLVIDIASNDGTSLSKYPKNLIRHGIDPTATKFSNYYEDGITFTPDFFNLDTALKVRKKFNKKAKIITSFSVFYDLPDPKEFVSGIEKLLHKDGIWMAEQSYLPLMLETNSFDTICHEHLEYYSLTDIKNLIAESDLEIFDIEFTPTNGGSFIFYISKKNNSDINIESEKIEKILKKEESNCSFESIRKFADKCYEQKELVKAWFLKKRSEGKKIAGLGASTKGNIALSFFDLTKNDISIIGDVNQDKFNSYTPVGFIPIIDQKILLEMDFEYFVVLPWHFRDYFLSQKTFAGKKLVFLHPYLEVIEI